MAMIKNFDELTIQDNFLFQYVMQDKELCKHLIERILGIKIERIEMPVVEKTIGNGLLSKSIRLDVYVKDNEERVYDIEMQCTNEGQLLLAKRARYYQSMMDSELLLKGRSYVELNPSFVIFICTFDPFKYGLPMYTFTHCCKQDNTIKLSDEATHVFLNAKAAGKAEDADIAAFLDYVDGNLTDNRFAQRMDSRVKAIKALEPVRRDYMLLRDELLKMKKDGVKEGIEIGKEKGIEIGREKERHELTEKYIQIIMKKLNLSYDDALKFLTEVAEGDTK